jgi:radical SAM-linked protein
MTNRIRLTFSKTQPLRYVGHLDFQRVWERTLRRSRLPVAYSQGFNPQVRLHLACALPLGMTSQCELVDFWLEGPMELSDIRSALHKALPPGIEVQSMAEIDLKEPALQKRVSASEYQLTLLDFIGQEELEQRVQILLAAPALLRERREKNYDLRPLIESLNCLPPDEQGRARLQVRLAAREGATGRPEELLAALGFDPTLVRVERTQLFLAEMN